MLVQKLTCSKRQAYVCTIRRESTREAIARPSGLNEGVHCSGGGGGCYLTPDLSDESKGSQLGEMCEHDWWVRKAPTLMLLYAPVLHGFVFCLLFLFFCDFQRQFDVTKEDLRSLNPSASANLLWGLVKTGAAFADDFDGECLEAVAADMGPKLLSFSPRVSNE